MAAKKKRLKVSLLLLIVVFLAAAVLFFVYSKPSEKKAELQSTPTSSVEETTGHQGYEEPLGGNGLRTVDIEENGELEPKTITVKVKEVIAFANESSEEQILVAEIDSTQMGGFAQEIIKPGEKLYLAQFTQPGVYTYFLKNNPQEKGKIVVEK